VIVGRDVALWLTASTMRAALAPAGVAVTAIELPSKLGSASVYATMPALEPLHTKLGLDEAALLRVTRGSFSLGWNIVQPGRKAAFLAHGAYGASIDGNDFFPCWVKARRFGLEAELEDFSPTAMAARHGRLLLPDEAIEQFGRCDYGYHLPAVPYVALLKSRAQSLGVTIHEALDISVDREGETGLIQSVRTDAGSSLEGDLFIDATGAEARVVGELVPAVEDWRQFFPFGRRLSARGARFASVPSYAELWNSRGGWTAMIATQTATSVVHAYSAAVEDDAAAIATAEAASGLSLRDIAIEANEPGLREAAWTGNCVAIGASACGLDPLFDLDLHAVQLGIVHLLSLFPTTVAADAERVEYNRIIRSHFERLRDFQAALYAITGTVDAVPATLEHKLDAFRARGAIAPMEDECFAPDQWRALFAGLGLVPETWAPAIDTTAPERMKEGFKRILGFVAAKVREQPSHDRYLADIGANEAA
jgi:tryptophan halogenase